MPRTVLIHGLLGGTLIALLRLVEYRTLVLEHSLALCGGIVALVFAAVGLGLGRKLARERIVTRDVAVRVEVPVARREPFVRDPARVEALGITPRELDILEAMAAGLSNREIAERLFVSENTVKTHAARLFGKLAARRRTQAVLLAKEAGLLP
jgi:DNA-binding NarL/FixJ family response regulator